MPAWFVIDINRGKKLWEQCSSTGRLQFCLLTARAPKVTDCSFKLKCDQKINLTWIYLAVSKLWYIHTYLQVVKYTDTSMPFHNTGNIVLQYFFFYSKLTSMCSYENEHIEKDNMYNIKWVILCSKGILSMCISLYCNCIRSLICLAYKFFSLLRIINVKCKHLNALHMWWWPFPNSLTLQAVRLFRISVLDRACERAQWLWNCSSSAESPVKTFPVRLEGKLILSKWIILFHVVCRAWHLVT